MNRILFLDENISVLQPRALQKFSFPFLFVAEFFLLKGKLKHTWIKISIAIKSILHLGKRACCIFEIGEITLHKVFHRF